MGDLSCVIPGCWRVFVLYFVLEFCYWILSSVFLFFNYSFYLRMKTCTDTVIGDFYCAFFVLIYNFKFNVLKHRLLLPVTYVLYARRRCIPLSCCAVNTFSAKIVYLSGESIPLFLVLNFLFQHRKLTIY